MCVLACLSVLRLDPTPQHNLISQTLQTEFFSKYNNSIQRDMAAAMKMEHFKANEVVFYQGDQPGVVGKYYIIAYGRVRITVEQTTQLDEAEPKGKGAGKAKSGGGDGPPKGGGDDQGAENSSPEGHAPISKLTYRRQRRKSTMNALAGGQLLTELWTGEGFGELALLSDRARAATAVCAEETVLLTLDKTSYLSLMKNEHQRTQEVNRAALTSLRLFKNCTMDHINNIAPYFVIQNHNRGTVFNPDRDDHVSFILKGHAVVAYGVPRPSKTNSKEASVFDPVHVGGVGARAGPHGATDASHATSSHGLTERSTSKYDTPKGDKAKDGGKGKGEGKDGRERGGGASGSPGGSGGTSPSKKKSGKAKSHLSTSSTKASHSLSSKREHNLFVIRDLGKGDFFGETCVFQQFQRGYQVVSD